MYKQVLDPVGNSLFLSTLFAALPLVTLFVLLGGLKLKAHVAALWSLLVAILVAIIVYSMPVGQTLDAGAEGAAFGLFPIMWIVVNAIWIYNMADRSGHIAVIRRSFGRLSDDQRVQAVLIAFCFGALLEALAGFGTPVAICSVMLIGLGFQPAKAAAVSLVACGAIAVPITTLAPLANLPKDDLGAMVGRQTPFLALVVPLILVGMVDGKRGIRQCWPAAVVGGFAFAIGQYACSNFLSVELTDIVASLLSVGALVAFLRVWQPSEPLRAEGTGFAQPAMAGGAAADPTFEAEVRRREGGEGHVDSRRDKLIAYAPYIIIIAIFAVAQWNPLKTWMADNAVAKFDWPGLNVLNAKGEAPTASTYVFNWLPAAGTLLLIAGLISMLVLRMGPGRAVKIYGETLDQLKWATLTVMTVLGLAYVMNSSGQTTTIGQWIAGAGDVLPFLSPIIGWLGVAVTGSDTSSNSLFGVLQVTAAKNAGFDPTLLAAVPWPGGVLGKMISPQNLAIGAAALGLAGQEGDIFRPAIKWSLILLLIISFAAFLRVRSA